jgi:hypothetical protein
MVAGLNNTCDYWAGGNSASGIQIKCKNLIDNFACDCTGCACAA